MIARRPGACAVLAVLCLPGVAAAHVGSPNVTAAGNAGPYPLSVMVRPPAQAPGLATVEITTKDDRLRALRLAALPLGRPAPEAAAPVVARRHAAAPDAAFAAELWIGSPGSWRLDVVADGDAGAGTLSVVVPQPRRIGAALRILLVALRIVLALGIAAFMGKAVERTRRRRLAWTGLAALAVFVGVGVTFGRLPPADCLRNQIEASVSAGQLGLRVPDRPWACGAQANEVMLDHGHAMHLFLVRLPALDRILHLHPAQIDRGRFVHDVPDGAPGQYQIYADIVDASGPATLVGEIALPAAGGHPLAGDDAAGEGPPVARADLRRTAATLSDGGRLIWNRGPAPLRSGRLTEVTFSVENAQGAPARDLQPYMGMLGHAVFLRHDRAVFAHVHPTGSVPMAAAAALGEGPGPAPSHACAPPAGASSVTFPYGFPGPGAYRVFVQIKRNDRVETGVFDAAVDD